MQPHVTLENPLTKKSECLKKKRLPTKEKLHSNQTVSSNMGYYKTMEQYLHEFWWDWWWNYFPICKTVNSSCTLFWKHYHRIYCSSKYNSESKRKLWEPKKWNGMRKKNSRMTRVHRALNMIKQPEELSKKVIRNTKISKLGFIF